MSSPAGHYQDADSRHWLHQVYDGSAYGAPDRDTDQWIDPWGKIREPKGQLELLVPLSEVLSIVTSTRMVGLGAGTDGSVTYGQQLRFDHDGPSIAREIREAFLGSTSSDSGAS